MSIQNLFGTSGIIRLVDKRLVKLSLNVGLAMAGDYRQAVVGYDIGRGAPVVR
ncbi:hypothetical protein ACFLXC_06375 [Chloroflexota bacterium]